MEEDYWGKGKSDWIFLFQQSNFCYKSFSASWLKWMFLKVTSVALSYIWKKRVWHSTDRVWCVMGRWTAPAVQISATTSNRRQADQALASSGCLHNLVIPPSHRLLNNVLTLYSTLVLFLSLFYHVDLLQHNCPSFVDCRNGQWADSWCSSNVLQFSMRD